MDANAHEEPLELGEAQDALKYYLDMLDSTIYGDSIASNCIVDWFGVSLRGPEKIQHFFKYEIKAQLRHDEFNRVEQCDPIEVKPLHMTTINLPSMTSAPTFRQAPINYGVNMRNYAESEGEDESASSSFMDISSNSNNMQQTSTTSQTLDDDDSLDLMPLPLSDVDSDEAESINVAKRAKYANQRKIKARRNAPIESDSEADDEDEEVQPVYNPVIPSIYTPLQYLKTSGRLYTLNLIGVLERAVRLHISYRRSLIDNSIQFALIIYEILQEDGQVRPMPRRNLAHEFDAPPALPDAQPTITEETQTPQQLVQQQPHYQPLVVTVDSLTTPSRNTTTLTDVEQDEDEHHNNDGDGPNLTAYSALRTPTKVSTDPPATPRRRRRDGHMHLKRTYDSVPSFTANADPNRKPLKRCNAARTLRL